MRKYLCDECKQSEIPRPAHKCPGCRKLKASAWYEANKDKYLQWTRKYRAEHPDRVRENRRAYEHIKRSDPVFQEKRRQYDAKWRRENTETYYSRQLRYRLKNRDKWLEQKAMNYSKKNYGLFAQAQRALLKLKKEIKEGQVNENSKHTDRRKS